MKADDAERLKELERENATLKRIVADKEPGPRPVNQEAVACLEPTRGSAGRDGAWSGPRRVATRTSCARYCFASSRLDFDRASRRDQALLARVTISGHERTEAQLGSPLFDVEGQDAC
jgi:hypothetical protein